MHKISSDSFLLLECPSMILSQFRFLETEILLTEYQKAQESFLAGIQTYFLPIYRVHFSVTLLSYGFLHQSLKSKFSLKGIFQIQCLRKIFLPRKPDGSKQPKIAKRFFLKFRPTSLQNYQFHFIRNSCFNS